MVVIILHGVFALLCDGYQGLAGCWVWVLVNAEFNWCAVVRVARFVMLRVFIGWCCAWLVLKVTMGLPGGLVILHDLVYRNLPG